MSASLPHVFVVILAGGGGTRLWPKSRNKTPKQFLRLYTENTLMQDAYLRVRDLVDDDHIIVVTNAEYEEEVHKQLPNVPKQNIIGEPAKRETAAAMLLGALIAKHYDPEAIVINQASDHVVTNHSEFVRELKAAALIAARGTSLVAVGIFPTFAHTGFGYIKVGEELESIDGLPTFAVAKFTEKPDLALAQAFVATGKYFWNANMYVWKADTLFEAFEQHSPAILKELKVVKSSIGTPSLAAKLEAAYKNIEKISIDYAISEKVNNLVLIPGDFGWNDIGDWAVVHALSQKNDVGNTVLCETGSGQVMFHDSKNNLIHAQDRLIALVGINDMVVVDTGEILLVMPKNRSQDVKKIVEEIKEQNPQYL